LNSVELTLGCESAWFQPLNLKFDILVSKSAFQINLYRYIKERDAVIEEQDMKLGALGNIDMSARTKPAAGKAGALGGTGSATSGLAADSKAGAGVGGGGGDVVSQMKERIYALSREAAAAGRERDALKAALITAGMAPAAVLEHAAKNHPSQLAPGSGRRALLGGGGEGGGGGRQFPIPSAIGGGCTS
jgi:hypothetical protein